MLSPDIVRCPPFQNVLAAGVATSDLLQTLGGYVIERLYLQLGGGAFTKAMMTQIQIKANGKIIFDSTGSRTDTRNQYRKLALSAGMLVIDFIEPRLKSKRGMFGGGLDTTVGLSSLRVEVTIAGATTPTLLAFAEVRKPDTSGELSPFRAVMARVHSVQLNASGAGDFQLVLPHFDPIVGGSVFKRVWFYSANMTALKVLQGGVLVHDNVKVLNDFRQQDYDRSPQASVWVWDGVVDGWNESIIDTRPDDNNPLSRTALVTGTFSGAETITAEVETLETIAQF